MKRCMTALIVGAVLLLTAVGVVPAAHAAPPTPNFGPAIDGYQPYVGQSTCSPTPKPGVVDFRDLLRATYGRADLGIGRDCGVGGQSEHKEGRALDYPFNAFDANQKAQADDLVGWLLATDQHGNTHALARRLGIMYIIWNQRIWEAYRPGAGWQPYGGASPHTDHVHVSFGWPGAQRQTSWWTSAQPQRDRSVGDVTGDGYPDLTAIEADGRLAVYGNGILIPAFGGRPFQGRMWRTDNTNWNQDARSITVAEVTGDGFADFLVLTADQLLVYGNSSRLGNGSPFTTVYRTYGGWGGATNIAAGDVNGDSWADLAATMSNGQLHIYLNTKETGANAWPFRGVSFVYQSGWGADVTDIAIGDVTGDAFGDLLATRTDGTLSVFGNGIRLPAYGGFPFRDRTWLYASGWDQVADIATSDVSGDGFADLMAVTTSGQLQIYGNGIRLPAHEGMPFKNATWTYTGWQGVHHIA
jgi:hypothetical protein